MGKPSKKDYGYVKPSAFIFESKGWTIEGGKEAYHKDLLEYRKLIAAAPEMLEFIQKYYRYLNLPDQKIAEDLIKKATE